MDGRRRLLSWLNRAKASGPKVISRCRNTVGAILVAICAGILKLSSRFMPAVFIACLFATDVLQPPQQWLTAVFDAIGESSSAVDVDQADPTVNVALISAQTYEQRYSATSPLNRCLLGRDLALALHYARGARVVVDLDLSPQSGVGAEVNACQQVLDDILVQNAGRLAVILPSLAATPEWNASRAEWLGFVCDAGVYVADPTIDVDYELILRRPTSLARGFTPVFVPQSGSTQPPSASPICAQLKRPRPEWPLSPTALRCMAALRSSDAKRERAAVACIVLTEVYRLDGNLEQTAVQLGIPASPAPQRRPMLAYQALGGKVRCFSADRDQKCSLSEEECSGDDLQCGIAGQLRSMSAADVIVFGGDYDSADQFRTPLGVYPGAVLHAIIALKSSAIEVRPWLKFFVDLLVGMFLIYPIEYIWRIWHHAHLQAWPIGSGARAIVPQSAWVISVLQLLAVLALVSSTLLAASYVLRHFHVWLNPVGVMIGVVIDSFVFTGIDVAQEFAHARRADKLRDGSTPSGDKLGTESSSAWASFVAAMKARIWLADVSRQTQILHLVGQALRLGVIGYGLYSVFRN